MSNGIGVLRRLDALDKKKWGGSNPQKNKIPCFACKGLKAGNSMKYNVSLLLPKNEEWRKIPHPMGEARFRLLFET